MEEGDAAKARAAFDQVTQAHARSDAAPGAYYYLGLLTLNRATTPPEIEDALAQFARVETLYPREHLGAARARGPGARAPARGALRGGERPQPPGLARVPRLRRGRRAPSTRSAARWRSRASRARRWRSSSRSATASRRAPGPSPRSSAHRALPAVRRRRSPRSRWTRLSRPAPATCSRTCARCSMAPSGALWIASDKTKSAIPIDAAGKLGAGLHRRGPAHARRCRRQASSCWPSRTAVRVGPKDIRSFTTPPEKPGAPPKPVDKILAAALTPGGAVLVSDEEREAILRYDAQGRVPGHLPRRPRRGQAQGDAHPAGRRGRDRDARPGREDGPGLGRDRPPAAQRRARRPQAPGGRRGRPFPQPLRGRRGGRGPGVQRCRASC